VDLKLAGKVALVTNRQWIVLGFFFLHFLLVVGVLVGVQLYKALGGRRKADTPEAATERGREFTDGGKNAYPGDTEEHHMEPGSDTRKHVPTQKSAAHRNRDRGGLWATTSAQFVAHCITGHSRGDRRDSAVLQSGVLRSLVGVTITHVSTGELTLARIRLNELLSVVQLYKASGGRRKADTPDAATERGREFNGWR